MAGDLIPPPSPAGRPEVPGVETPPKDDATQTQGSAEFRHSPELVEKTSSVGPGGDIVPRKPGKDVQSQDEDRDLLLPETALPRIATPYRTRFRFQLGILVGIAFLVVGLTYFLASGNDHHTGPANWSAWKPTAGEKFAAAQQIAEHISQKYRLDSGDQLVVVRAGPLEIANLPVEVVIRNAPNNGDLKLIEGDGVLYTLSGLGANGSIDKGDPSTERHLLLRREALEMALYTFRYVPGVDHVVALLPPRPPEADTTADPTATDESLQALFYRSGDVSNLLDRPLATTIASQAPKPKIFAKQNAAEKAIAKLTDNNLFQATFQQGQDARAFMVLDKIVE